MRACRRFLAGIPHFRPGHPCVTHPSATPSLLRERTFDLHVLGTPPAFILSQDQTRHPLFMSPPTRSRALRWSYPRCLSRDPGQAVSFALGCSQILACTLSPESTSLILDRNCCGRLRVSPVAVLLSTLQLSKYYWKQVLLASSPFSRDR